MIEPVGADLPHHLGDDPLGDLRLVLALGAVVGQAGRHGLRHVLGQDGAGQHQVGRVRARREQGVLLSKYAKVFSQDVS